MYPKEKPVRTHRRNTYKIGVLNEKRCNNGTLYSFHYRAKIKDGDFLDELYDVYKDTNLHFIHGIDPNTEILGTAHLSFITNNTNLRTILQMEDAYVQKNITKNKIHACLSERVGGLLADIAHNIRIDIGPDKGPYFLKRCLQRNYT